MVESIERAVTRASGCRSCSALCSRRSRSCRCSSFRRAVGRVTRRQLAIAALVALFVGAAGLIGLELANGAADAGALAVRDPCEPRPAFPGEGLDAVLQRIVLDGLDGAACELGTTREELVLSLAPELERGSDPLGRRDDRARPPRRAARGDRRRRAAWVGQRDRRRAPAPGRRACAGAVADRRRPGDRGAVRLGLARSGYTTTDGEEGLVAVDRSYVDANRASLDRLKAFVEKASDADLEHPMNDGWTVATVLAHVAFWDLRIVACAEAWGAHGSGPAPTYHDDAVDWINDSVKPLDLRARTAGGRARHRRGRRGRRPSRGRALGRDLRAERVARVARQPRPRRSPARTPRRDRADPLERLGVFSPSARPDEPLGLFDQALPSA